MLLRELSEADLPALLELCQLTLPYDTFTLSLLQRRIFADPQPGPHYRLAATNGSQLIGCLVVLHRTYEQHTIGSILLLLVHPNWQRKGIATQLLNTTEQQLRQAGLSAMTVGGSAPNFFWAGIDMRYTSAYCLFEKRGFKEEEIRVNQRVDLQSQSWDTSAAEAQLQQDGITVRRLTQADREPFCIYMQQHWNQGWLDETLNSYQNNPISAFLAFQHNQICGFAAYNSEGFAGHFGPTGTNESLRGKGIGRVLFYYCMRDLADQQLANAEVVWVGPISFYTRIAGAIVHRAFWAMSKQLEEAAARD
jgi:mycothiol synthase